jgi:hypothetical protein
LPEYQYQPEHYLFVYIVFQVISIFLFYFIILSHVFITVSCFVSCFVSILIIYVASILTIFADEYVISIQIIVFIALSVMLLVEVAIIIPIDISCQSLFSKNY